MQQRTLSDLATACWAHGMDLETQMITHNPSLPVTVHAALTRAEESMRLLGIAARDQSDAEREYRALLRKLRPDWP